MQYLTAAVGLVGSLCLLDLVLTLGVVRRLRDHTERLTALSGVSRPAASSDSLLPVGSVPDDFGVSTLDGSLVSRELLGAPALVAFFTPGCAPCRERVPEFVEYASGVPVGRDRTLAVVVGDDGDASDLASDLADAARVVLEQRGGPVSTAFAVRSFPTLYALDGAGAVAAAGHTVDQLPTPPRR